MDMNRLDLIFNGANLFVLPFWTLMIVLPKWNVTRTIMASATPFIVLALVYVYLFANSLTPDSAESFSNPTLPELAKLFAEPSVTATGWVHFLVMDLFVGWWIYQDGQQSSIWTTHSLLFCLFAGPIGLLSHLTTRLLTKVWRDRNNTTAEPSGDSAADSAG
jgi:hypothetical protein